MSSTNLLKSTTSDEPQEIRIKVPWGHIAGKWWGAKHVRPILCLHGWLDNAGTFDRIIPLLPKHVGYLAIDFPGHGLSSRLPDGMLYNNFQNVPLLKHIMKIYNWDKISVIGHSMGAVITFTFASLYPDDIDMYIAIDVIKNQAPSIQKYVNANPSDINAFLIADERNRNNSEPPSYTYETCIEKLVGGTSNSVDRASAPHLLDRNLAKSEISPEQYYFRRDNRLKTRLSSLLTHDINMEIAKGIKCPHLHIRAEDANIVGRPEEYFEILEFLKKNNPKFEYDVVDGKHHVHLTAPELVQGIMSDFINKYRPSIQSPSKL